MGKKGLGRELPLFLLFDVDVVKKQEEERFLKEEMGCPVVVDILVAAP